ncbi:hypothetical protein IE53DRAFT_331173 [Violaceomyces palustris]|uniref:Uncharacterized protein n=1 Tax=Violaceomyces palustris TaxID=1673888 RepID=A0ACD0NVR2_9BASI|nr:hypothetical protein IE53DRAFT_331173 [Violaceomyces palustris]
MGKRGSRGGGKSNRGGFTPFSGKGQTLGGAQDDKGSPSSRGGVRPFVPRGRGGKLTVTGQNHVSFDYSSLARNKEGKEEEEDNKDADQSGLYAMNSRDQSGRSTPVNGTRSGRHAAYPSRGSFRGRGRALAPTSFPAFHTSRGAGGKGNRPPEESEDAMYLAGIPGLRSKNSRSSGHSTPRKADFGLDHDKPLRRPVTFVKATGEWKDGVFVRFVGVSTEEVQIDLSLTSDTSMEQRNHDQLSERPKHAGLGFSRSSRVDPCNIDLDQLLKQQADEADEEDQVEGLLRAFPGSKELGPDETMLGPDPLPEGILEPRTTNSTVPLPPNRTRLEELRSSDESSSEDEEEIILIPSHLRRDDGAETIQAETDSDEERQLDAIIKETKAQLAEPEDEESEPASEQDFEGGDPFVIDLTGSSPQPESNLILYDTQTTAALGDQDAHQSAQEEVIDDGEGEEEEINWTQRQPRGLGKKARNAAKKARRRAKGKKKDSERPILIPREGDSDLDWGSDGPPGVKSDLEKDELENFGVEDLRIGPEEVPKSKEEEEMMLNYALEASLHGGGGGTSTRSVSHDKAAKNKLRGGARAKRSLGLIKESRDGDRRKATAMARAKRDEEAAILADYMENAMNRHSSDSEEDGSEDDRVDENGAKARKLKDRSGSSQDLDRPTELDAMIRFMKGMDPQHGGRELALGDIEDEEVMREEEEWMTESEDEDDGESESDEADVDSKDVDQVIGGSNAHSGGEIQASGPESGSESSDGTEGSDEELDLAVERSERLMVEGNASSSEDSDDDSFDSSQSSGEEEEEGAIRKGQGKNGKYSSKASKKVGSDSSSPKKKKKSRKHKIPKSWSEKDEEEDDDDESQGDSEEEEMFNGNFSWADRDEDFIDMLGQTRGKKDRKRLFKAIEKGDFGEISGILDDDDDMEIDQLVEYGFQPPAKRGKERSKKFGADDLWAEQLQAQWEKDRSTKAANKKKRAAERQAAAQSPFPNTHKKGTKKLEKKLRRAAKREAKARGKANGWKDGADDDDDDNDDDEIHYNFGGSATNLIHKANNLEELDRQIKHFLSDLGKTTLTLPPMDKRSRAQVHMLAEAYSLKSKSRGNGSNRFPTLIKTGRSGLVVDERKVRRIVSGKGQVSFGSGTSNPYKEKYAKKSQQNRSVGSTGGGALAPRNREGDEVGRGADKIGADNIGHKLLAMMGWTEGQGIGLEAGISDPVAATVKISKGGLGW